MTFAVGRIIKCTLKLKLLVFLFCSLEVGLSCHVKCAGVLVPCPNLRVSAKRPIVHFGDEGANTLNQTRSFDLIKQAHDLIKQRGDLSTRKAHSLQP